jgi:hypothetical protein
VLLRKLTTSLNLLRLGLSRPTHCISHGSAPGALPLLVEAHVFGPIFVISLDQGNILGSYDWTDLRSGTSGLA